MFTAKLTLADLIDLCRVLRHQLAAGISIHKVLKQQAERGRRSFRAIAGRVSEAIQRGSNLSDTLAGDKDAFPPLFLAMVKLGESTGHMAEIFGEMERYFQLELQLRAPVLHADAVAQDPVRLRHANRCRRDGVLGFLAR